MPIEFRCTQCGKLLRTGDDTAGRQAQCPECGTIGTVPGPAGPQEPPIPLSPPDGASPPVSGSPFAGAAGGENPFQMPSAGMREALAVQRVSAPATALIVYAILSIVVDSLMVVGAIFAMAFAPAGAHGEEQAEKMMVCGVYSVIGLVGLALAIVILIGAVKMKKLDSYAFAMTAAIIAVIPCFSSCWLLGLPFGIWAIVVLGDSSVKAAFRR